MIIEEATEPFVEYNAVNGSYGRVKYFMTKTNLRDAAENLSLAPQKDLNFESRIQRVVNINRVEKEILPYLENDDLRFFNSLVCILLPDTDNEHSYWGFKEYKDSNGQKLGLGKLRLAKRISRVVLDGQHRYEALKMLWDKYKDDLYKDEVSLEEIAIPIVFLVVDNIGKIGLEDDSLRSKTISNVRSMFAVLNKTAKQVDKSTLLLIDDTNILNVITRKLLSDDDVNEIYTKWSGGQNLDPKDPYFTSLQVILDIVKLFFCDVEEVKKYYGDSTQREIALKRFYEKAMVCNCSIKHLVNLLIGQSCAYKNWLKIIDSENIKIKQQPERTNLTKAQRKVLEGNRKKELSYTVAGQKALFRSIIHVFKNQKSKNDKALLRLINDANTLINNDLYNRSKDPKNPYYNLLFDSKNRMNNAESIVDCARKILSVGLGSNASRTSIVDHYMELTDNQESILQDYWETCSECLKKSFE